MTCTLLIPVEGIMELWNYERSGVEVLNERGHNRGLAQIELTSDSVRVGIAVFSTITDGPINPRATAAIHFLIGAYVQVEGPLVLERISEAQAIEIMQEVAA